MPPLEQAVEALAVTSKGESFVFACNGNINMVEMCGYTIIYSLQMPQGHDILCLVFALGEVAEVDYTCHGELLADRSQLIIYQSESNEPDSTVVMDVKPSEPVVDVVESTDGNESGEASDP